MRYLRLILFVAIIFVILAIPASLVLARSYFLAPTAQPVKDQPIHFPHTVHVQALGMDCTYCHRSVTVEAHAGLPSVELCMQCHKIISPQGRPELEKLVAAFQENRPILWNKVHQLPDHSHFVHSVHVSYGLECSTCHGNVGAMGKPGVKQVRDLRMGDCLTCHQQMGARMDCSSCHY
ncbi:MAG: cytochrome c3 family protein [Thermomicrobium sp.]|jgi:hypothetical protein|nr:cytochrome c3 family protein [Thermomicrobium sp.]